jgi:hypothetical protein
VRETFEGDLAALRQGDRHPCPRGRHLGGIAGTEWRRTHLRLLLKRGRHSHVDMVVSIPDELLNTEGFAQP